MNEFDDQLKETMKGETQFDEGRGEAVKRTALSTFTTRLKTVERVAVVYVVGFILLGVLSIIQFLKADGTKEQLLWVIVFIIAIQMRVLLNLWYWILNNKYGVLKEVAELRFEVAETKGTNLEPSQVRVDPVFLPHGLSKKERLFWKTAMAGIVAIALFAPEGIFALMNETKYTSPPFIGEQADEMHLTEGETFEVRSVITLTEFPHTRGWIALDLPYENAKIESVTRDGVAVDLAGENRVDWEGQEVEEAGHRRLVVNWTFPLKNLDPGRENDGRRLNLQGLIPITALSVSCVLEEGCGYERCEDATEREFFPFWGRSDSPKREFGSCGLGIRKSAGGR